MRSIVSLAMDALAASASRHGKHSYNQRLICAMRLRYGLDDNRPRTLKEVSSSCPSPPGIPLSSHVSHISCAHLVAKIVPLVTLLAAHDLAVLLARLRHMLIPSSGMTDCVVLTVVMIFCRCPRRCRTLWRLCGCWYRRERSSWQQSWLKWVL